MPDHIASCGYSTPYGQHQTSSLTEAEAKKLLDGLKRSAQRHPPPLLLLLLLLLLLFFLFFFFFFLFFLSLSPCLSVYLSVAVYSND